MRPAIERRIAVVTGAAGGIGKASARELGREYDLILTDLLEDRLEVETPLKDLFKGVDVKLLHLSRTAVAATTGL